VRVENGITSDAVEDTLAGGCGMTSVAVMVVLSAVPVRGLAGRFVTALAEAGLIPFSWVVADFSVSVTCWPPAVVRVKPDADVLLTVLADPPDLAHGESGHLAVAIGLVTARPVLPRRPQNPDLPRRGHDAPAPRPQLREPLPLGPTADAGPTPPSPVERTTQPPMILGSVATVSRNRLADQGSNFTCR
jgi:hypothetical protein